MWEAFRFCSPALLSLSFSFFLVSIEQDVCILLVSETENVLQEKLGIEKSHKNNRSPIV